MQDNHIGKAIKATIIHLIVALLVTFVLIGIIYLFAGQQIAEAFSLVNKVAIDLE